MKLRRSTSFLLLVICIGAILSSCASSAPPEHSLGAPQVAKQVSTIEIKLPETLVSMYMVPSQKPSGDVKILLSDAVKRRIRGSLGDGISALISRGFMQVEYRSKDKCPEIPAQMLAYMGAKPDQLSQLANAKGYILIRTTGLPGWPPRHELAGRAAAAALALEHNCILVDMYFPRVLTPQDALATVAIGKEIEFKNWIRVLTSKSETGCWMTSRGLARTGLPDLQAVEASPQLAEPLPYVMCGLAWNIAKKFAIDLSKNQRLTSFALPAEIEVSQLDISEAGWNQFNRKRKAKIHLRLDLAKDKDKEDFLTIVPPPGDKRSTSEYLTDICDQLLGKSPDIHVDIGKTPEMITAMDTARASLPAIRARFLADKIPLNADLLVKFRVTDGKSTEYLWAYVTAWKLPDELEANCGNRCNLDPKLRPGKQVHLKLDSIVDWGIYENDKFIEGGWTNKVLGQ
jgi:hypothetical protein